jgi:MFS family permease
MPLSRKNLSELVSDPPFPVFLLLVSAYFIGIFFRISASVVMPMEAERLAMSAAMTGFVSSLHFYSYAFMQPVAGVLHDRFGPVRVVTAGLFVTAASSLLMTFMRTPFTLGAWRLLSGLGVAPMYGATLVFQSFAFPQERYCFYAGINFALSNLGAIVSVAPLGFVLDTFGIGTTFAFLTAVNLAVMVVLGRSAKRDPLRAVAARRERRPLSSLLPEIRDALAYVIRNRRMRGLLILWAISSASMLTFQGLWGVSWFVAAYGAAPGAARFWASMISFGMMLGPLISGGRIIRPETLPGTIRNVCIGNTLAWAILFGVVAAGLPLQIAGIATLLVGVSSGMRGVFAMAGVNALSGKGNNGAIFGAMNMIVVLMAVVFQWGTGVIINFFPAAVPGTYTASGYLAGFGVVLIAMATSLFSLRLVGKRPLG